MHRFPDEFNLLATTWHPQNLLLLPSDLTDRCSAHPHIWLGPPRLYLFLAVLYALKAGSLHELLSNHCGKLDYF